MGTAEPAVDDFVLQTTNEKLPIADHDARWSARIDEDHTAGLADVEDIPALARSLDQGLVLAYLNGGDLVPRLEEREAQPDDGRDTGASA